MEAINKAGNCGSTRDVRERERDKSNKVEVEEAFGRVTANIL